MHCVGTLSWSGMGLGWLARPSRQDQEAPTTGARRPQQIPEGKELVQGRFLAGLAIHPTEEDLSMGVPALHPTDVDLSVGTPDLGHPDL